MARSDKKQSKHDKMTKQPVEKLIVKLAIPTIVSMLVSSFYNLVDTVFVGRLEDENSTAAVSVVFSLMAIIQAFGFFCGHGSGNYISRALGRKETEKAERMAATGFFLAGGIGALILLFGLLFLEPFALLLGSKEGAMLVHTEKYMFYILIAAPVMCMSLVLNNQLRYQGNAVYAMAGITSGAVLNIGLDAWLVPKVGVEGAAIATMISQFVSFGILLTGMLRSDSLRIRFRNFTPRLDYFKEIVIGGTPSLCRQGLGSICTVCINTVAGHFGDAAAIAAIGIVQRFMMFVSSATIGFGQGFQPVCGFNYGAGLYDRVRRAFWFCVKVAAVFLTAIALLCFGFTEEIVAFVQRGESENIEKVLAIGGKMLRFQLCGLPLMSFTVIANMYMQTIGKVFRASFLALCRQGIMLIPLLYLLTYGLSLLGGDPILGIQIAQPIADLLSLAAAVPMTLPVLLNMGKRREIPESE